MLHQIPPETTPYAFILELEEYSKGAILELIFAETNFLEGQQESKCTCLAHHGWQSFSYYFHDILSIKLIFETIKDYSFSIEQSNIIKYNLRFFVVHHVFILRAVNSLVLQKLHILRLWFFCKKWLAQNLPSKDI